MTGPGEHQHYEHYDPAMAERLDGSWGYVERAINRGLAARLEGRERVLDLGCGFGSLTSELSATRRVVGIDPLLFCLGVAARRYPGARAVCGSAEALPLRQGSADEAVLKDVLHHLVDEASIDRVFGELARVGVRRVVVMDPNPNPFLRLARRLVGHTDPVCTAARATGLLEAAGFRVESEEFEVLFSLPLSGGYVGPVLLPPWRALWRPLLLLEKALCAVLNRLRLARHVCWRYCLVASREPGALRVGGGDASSGTAPVA